MIALPDTAGAHRNTASGDGSLTLQLPASVPVPVVVPVFAGFCAWAMFASRGFRRSCERQLMPWTL